MDCIRIVGGKKLHGKISIQGSKNAALPMIAAAVLHRGISILKNCPKITDVFYMEEILQCLGAVTWWEGADLFLDCTYADRVEIPERLSEKMRSSVMLMGALLARNKAAVIGYPGGCVIGKRPIDMHIEVLEKMGAEIYRTSGKIFASSTGLTGTEVCFMKKSVGATEQGILSSVLAAGKTILRNCALEPEIVHLCSFLRKMGADIKGDGSDCITIEGKEELQGAMMNVPPDRIVAGTYFCAAAITRSEIELEHVPIQEMDAFLKVYHEIGGQYKGKSGTLVVDGSGVQYPADIKTGSYPEFPTDLQSLMTAVLATIPGESHVQETVFEDRYKVITQLELMGANIKCEGADAYICGVPVLRGCDVCAQELRGGAALLIAALAARGESRLAGYHYIRRGYAGIYEEMKTLGGCLTKDMGTELYENIQLS